MGRVRRQRKYKSCDPFSKEGEKKSEKFNLAPKKDDFDDHFEETKSVKIFKRQIGLASSKNAIKKQKDRTGSKKSKDNVKDAVKKTLPRQPNETQKQYFRRLDENIQNAANEAIKEQHRIRAKRKDHLKARDEKKKLKGNNIEKEERDFKSLKDEVKFGEVVNEPPSISFKPRKTLNNQNTINKTSSLILSSILEKNSKVKKRKNMSQDEMKDHDINRQAAIDAYRMLKKKKEKKDDIT